MEIDKRKTTVKTYEEKIIVETQLKQAGIRECRKRNYKTHTLDYRERIIEEISIVGK